MELGVPLAAHKCMGPSTCLVFLGIEIDTIAMEFRLPQEKLSKLEELLSEWQFKKVSQERNLSHFWATSIMLAVWSDQADHSLASLFPFSQKQNGNIATSLGLTVKPDQMSDGGTCSLNLGMAYPSCDNKL